MPPLRATWAELAGDISAATPEQTLTEYVRADEIEKLTEAAVKDQAEIKRLQGLVWKQQPGTRAQRRVHLQPETPK